MKPIDLQFTYTKQQIIKAYQFHYNKKFHTKRDMIIASLLFVWGCYSLYTEGFNYSGLAIVILPILLILMIVFVSIIRPSICYKQNKKFHEAYHLSFTEDGLHFKTTEADSNLKWSYYDRMMENEEFILLYYAKNAFSILPKNAFKNKEELIDFTQFVKAKLAKL